MSESRIFELSKCANGYRGGIELPNGEVASLFIGKVNGEAGRAVVKLGKKVFARGFVAANTEKQNARSPDGFIMLDMSETPMKLSAWRWRRENVVRVAYTRVYEVDQETGL